MKMKIENKCNMITITRFYVLRDGKKPPPPPPPNCQNHYASYSELTKKKLKDTQRCYGNFEKLVNKYKSKSSIMLVAGNSKKKDEWNMHRKTSKRIWKW